MKAARLAEGVGAEAGAPVHEGAVDAALLRLSGLPVAFGGGGLRKRRRASSRTPWDKEGGRGGGEVQEDDEMQDGLVPEGMRDGEPLSRYWRMRYLLWSRFDEGVGMDPEGWWSVTPERIASHHAKRMGASPRVGVAVDAFCGCGGNAVQLARVFRLVVAVDSSPERLDLARRNAALYGVDDRIDFVLGDCRDVLRGLAAAARRRSDRESDRDAGERERETVADACFLSPPWGGPDYLKAESFDATRGLGEALGCGPSGVAPLLRLCLEVTPNVALYLPRNTDVAALAELLDDAGVACAEVEACSLNGRPKALTVYTGALVAEWGGVEGREVAARTQSI